MRKQKNKRKALYWYLNTFKRVIENSEVDSINKSVKVYLDGGNTYYNCKISFIKVLTRKFFKR